MKISLLNFVKAYLIWGGKGETRRGQTSPKKATRLSNPYVVVEERAPGLRSKVSPTSGIPLLWGGRIEANITLAYQSDLLEEVEYLTGSQWETPLGKG